MFLFPFSFYRVIGHSMEPAIKDGSLVVIERLTYLFKSPQIGEVVLISHHNKKLIKRISKIDELGYYLVGDNSQDSFDSRRFGLIPKKGIIGKVVAFW